MRYCRWCYLHHDFKVCQSDAVKRVQRIGSELVWKRVGILFLFRVGCSNDCFNKLSWKWVGLKMTKVGKSRVANELSCFCWVWVRVSFPMVLPNLGLENEFGWKRVRLLGWIWRFGFVVFSTVLPHIGLENEFGWKRVGLLGWIWRFGFVVFSTVLPHIGLENEFGWKRVGVARLGLCLLFFNGFATHWVGKWVWLENELGCFVGSGFVFLSMVLPHIGLENEFGWKRVGLLGWGWVCCFCQWFCLTLG